uniref:Uncharacterized protein n=1 Tax=Arundo donax TaxID=35708 RepID=A0A0A9RYD5_ARUDO
MGTTRRIEVAMVAVYSNADQHATDKTVSRGRLTCGRATSTPSPSALASRSAPPACPLLLVIVSVLVALLVSVRFVFGVVCHHVWAG